MEEFKVNDYILIKGKDFTNSCIGKIITVRQNVIHDIDLLILIKYPKNLYNILTTIRRHEYSKLKLIKTSNLLISLYD